MVVITPSYHLEKSLLVHYKVTLIYLWINVRKCILLVMKESFYRIIFDLIGIRLWLIDGG